MATLGLSMDPVCVTWSFSHLICAGRFFRRWQPWTITVFSWVGEAVMLFVPCKCNSLVLETAALVAWESRIKRSDAVDSVRSQRQNAASRDSRPILSLTDSPLVALVYASNWQACNLSSMALLDWTRQRWMPQCTKRLIPLSL